MSTYAPAAWTQHRFRCTTAHRRGTEVARLLLGNLEQATAAAGIELVVLAQFTFPAPDFPEQYGMVDDVLGGLRLPGTRVVNLGRPLEAIRREDPVRYQRFFFGQGHMTPEGNAWVADALAAVLRRKMVPPGTLAVPGDAAPAK